MTARDRGTDMTYCDEVRRTDKGIIVHGFGITDSMSRELGVKIHLATVEYVAHDRSCGYLGYEGNPGVYQVARPQATRDGMDFGATQSDRRFKTLAERDAYVAKYLANAEKRAKKAHTK